jgi:hypothetical protein
MNVLTMIYLVVDQNWIDWCKSHFPDAPCDPPPGADFTIGTILCVFIALLIAVTAIFHAISRLRISTPEEFRAANKRLSAGMELIIWLRGEELHQHCHLVSRDIIRITGFVQRHVSICFHNHRSSYSEDRYKMAAMMLFLRENKSLRIDEYSWPFFFSCC